MAFATRRRSEALVVAGIVLTIVGVFQIPQAILFLGVVTGTSATHPAVSNGRMFGTIASTAVFLLVGVTAILKGVQFKRGGDVNSKGIAG